jgi:hypothetical protein
MHQDAMDAFGENHKKVKYRGMSSVSQPPFEASRANVHLVHKKQVEVVSKAAGGNLKCTLGNTKLPCKILSRS